MRERICVASLALIVVCAGTVFAAAPVTVGEHVLQRLETPHPYPTSGVQEAMLSWADQIVFPGATYIAVHFERMELGDGDHVVVRSPDGEQSWMYTGCGRHDLGCTPDGFFATHIKGDTAVIELYTKGSTTGYGFAIDKFGRGYSDAEIESFWRQGLGEKMNLPPPAGEPESLCTTDDTEEVKCYQASEPDAYDTARAVARLLLNGSAHCTGWITGTAGHVLTNEHCIGSQSTMNNIDFEFMAEGPDCATNCGSSLACPGTIEASGGTFVIANAGLDYALVLPDTSTGSGTDLPATYGQIRMRETGAVLDERIYQVHHPAGWGKRFSMVSTYPDDVADGGFCYASSLSEPPCSGSGYNDVGYWSDTQGGSSGSVVVGYSDHKAVALHHCRGSAFCSSGNPASDDRNRGVPIQLVVADLDANGQLPPGSVCDPVEAPTNLTATQVGDNRIDLAWTGVGFGGATYNVYRSQAACPGGVFEPVAVGLTGTTYSDTDVSGGITYSYQVTAVEPADDCESDPTPCDDATATGVCTLRPLFDGIVAADNAQTSACGIQLSWDPATEQCGSGVVYNVYRSETTGFTPDASTLVASCVAATGYADADVLSGIEYYYVVRAEDDTGNGAGPCAGGNEDTNLEEASAFPTGPDILFFADDMESGDVNWTTYALPADTGRQPFQIVTTDSHSPTHSWFVSDEDSVKDQVAQLATPVDLTGAPAGKLRFWHYYDVENGFDGGVLEYSTDGGTTWYDVLDGDGGSVPANADRFLSGPYDDNDISTSFSSPIGGRFAWTDVSGGWIQTVVDLADFGGMTVSFRWRFACDTSVSDVGWWIDDVEVLQGTECTDGHLFSDGFESGDWSMWSGASP